MLAPGSLPEGASSLPCRVGHAANWLPHQCTTTLSTLHLPLRTQRLPHDYHMITTQLPRRRPLRLHLQRTPIITMTTSKTVITTNTTTTPTTVTITTASTTTTNTTTIGLSLRLHSIPLARRQHLQPVTCLHNLASFTASGTTPFHKIDITYLHRYNSFLPDVLLSSHTRSVNIRITDLHCALALPQAPGCNPALRALGF